MQVRGIDVRTSNVPGRVAYDLGSRDLYWHDNEYDGVNVVKRMSLGDGDVAEHSLTVLAPGENHNNRAIIIIDSGLRPQPSLPAVRRSERHQEIVAQVKSSLGGNKKSQSILGRATSPSLTAEIGHKATKSPLVTTGCQ